jgi:hypothetical protein
MPRALAGSRLDARFSPRVASRSFIETGQLYLALKTKVAFDRFPTKAGRLNSLARANTLQPRHGADANSARDRSAA